MAKFNRYVTYKEFLPSDYSITSKINPIYNSLVDRSRKSECSIRAAEVSLQRAHQSLFDVLRSNVWSFFVTLTFGDVEREDDQYCRDQFAKWRKEMRFKFPSMYYVAVPEYHKRGCLHYHVCVGGISADDLGLVDSGRVYHLGRSWLREDFDSAGFECNVDTGEGFTIYNVTSWSFGFSTVTYIRSSSAVANYVSKYLSKSNIDPRFYNKKRFYVSHNCNRPKVVKEVLEGSCHIEEDHVLDTGAILSYESPRLSLRKYDVDLSKEDIIRLRLLGEIPIPAHKLPF